MSVRDATQATSSQKIWVIEFSGYDEAEANEVFDIIEKLLAERHHSGVLSMRTEVDA
jgi:hypothetical protein